MSEPRPTPIAMWGDAKREVDALPWPWVEERLAATEDYWLVTAGDRGPSPRPVWGVWLDSRLLLTVGSTSHWRNVRKSDRVAVHLGDAHEVVIVEGTGRQETDGPTLDRLVEVYNRKYDWNFPPGAPGPVIAVAPTVVLAWRAGPTSEAKTNPFPLAAGRWLF